jgi:hypothetical protein
MMGLLTSQQRRHPAMATSSNSSSSRFRSLKLSNAAEKDGALAGCAVQQL